MQPRRGRFASLVATVGMTLSVTGASADGPAPAVAAEALFQEGRALLMAGKIEQACPKLEESHRLDPATGTLLAIALCHEQQGKLASAWADFADIEARSRLDGRADRERTAREHGAALRPRLSTLTVEVPKATADAAEIDISVDGVALRRGAWNTAIPIDGGEHVVAASARDRKPWRTTISIARERDPALVGVPVLPASVQPPVELRAETAPSGDTERYLPTTREGPAPVASTQASIGLVMLGAGVLGLGAATFLALEAKSDYDAARGECTDVPLRGETVCPPEPFARVQDAQGQGDLASVVAIAGGLVAISGAALWWWAPRRAIGDGAASARLNLTGRSLSISGRF